MRSHLRFAVIPVVTGMTTVLTWFDVAHADQPAAAPATTAQSMATPESVILGSLRGNPTTAPYRIQVLRRGNQFSLTGRVGTKQVHDTALQTVIALGYPVRDDLTIDTNEAHRVAAESARLARNRYAASASVPYVYPPPLFGRLDDPFLGFEPPLVSYPSWWGAVAAREPLKAGVLDPPASVLDVQPDGTQGNLPLGSVELTIDTTGVATLRGRVPTEADRLAVEKKVASARGIIQVVNQLEVGEGIVEEPSDRPPPPPTPMLPPINPAVGTKAPQPARPAQNEAKADRQVALAPAGDAIAQRVVESLARRPQFANSQLHVSTREGVATLSGRLPTAYEAMLAFRAVQQTPGVRDVIDRLEFTIPDVDQRNPLIDKGRPEDLEPYLTAQIRRQLGDQAHVDQVRVRGDALEVRGTVARANDISRIESTMRSIPILRGFQLSIALAAD